MYAELSCLGAIDGDNAVKDTSTVRTRNNIDAEHPRCQGVDFVTLPRNPCLNTLVRRTFKTAEASRHAAEIVRPLTRIEPTGV